MRLGQNKLELDGLILNFFSLVMPLIVDIHAPEMRLKIFSKSNCALVIALNDHFTQEKYCILRPDKKADQKQSNYMRWNIVEQNLYPVNIPIQ